MSVDVFSFRYSSLSFLPFVGPAMKSLLGMMRSKPKTVFAKRNKYTMDYGTAADE